MYQYPSIQQQPQGLQYPARSITQPPKVVQTKVTAPTQSQLYPVPKPLNSVYQNKYHLNSNNNSLTGLNPNNMSNYQNQQACEMNIQEMILNQQSAQASMLNESLQQGQKSSKQQLGHYQKVPFNVENNAPSYSQPKILKSSIKANYIQQSKSNRDLQDSILNTSKQTYSRKSEQGIVVKHLTDKITVLIEEINKLTATVDELLGENEKWKNKYRRVKQLYVNKISEVSTTKDKQKKQNELNDPQVEELKQVIKSYQQEINDLKKKYEDFKAHERSKCNDEQQKLIETIEIYQEDALNWKEKYEALASSAQKQNKMIEQLQNEKEQIKNQTKPPKNNQSQIISQYEQKLQESQDQINQLQENLQEYEQQLNQFADDNQNLQNELLQKDELIKEGSMAYKEKINQLQQEIEEMLQAKEQEQDRELMEENQLLQDKLNEIESHKQQLLSENQWLKVDQTQFFKQFQQANKQLETQLSQFPAQKEKPTEIPLGSPQSKPQQIKDGSDDYLVRQLRKFQEMQQGTKSSEPVYSKKEGKMQKGAAGKGSFGGKKQTKK